MATCSSRKSVLSKELKDALVDAWVRGAIRTRGPVTGPPEVELISSVNSFLFLLSHNNSLRRKNLSFLYPSLLLVGSACSSGSFPSSTYPNPLHLESAFWLSLPQQSPKPPLSSPLLLTNLYSFTCHLRVHGTDSACLM